jgi:hypothetical protein
MTGDYSLLPFYEPDNFEYDPVNLFRLEILKCSKFLEISFLLTGNSPYFGSKGGMFMSSNITFTFLEPKNSASFISGLTLVCSYGLKTPFYLTGSSMQKSTDFLRG